MVNARSGWKLVTFDLESYFRTFSIQAILNGLTYQSYFQFGNTSSEYLGHSSVSRSWVQGQGYGNEKAVACNTKNYCLKIVLARSECLLRYCSK